MSPRLSDRDSDPWPEDRQMGPAVNYPAGATLFQPGCPVQMLHLVLAGVVAIVLSDGDRDVLAGLRGPGWLVGAIPVLLGCDSDAAVILMTDCELRPIRSADLLELARTNPLVAQWLIRMQARELREQVRRVATLGTRDCRGRVEWLLVELFRFSHRLLQDGSLLLGFYVPVERLGQAAMASRGQVHRHLRDLVGEGLLRRRDRWLILPTRSSLHARVLGDDDP